MQAHSRSIRSGSGRPVPAAFDMAVSAVILAGGGGADGVAETADSVLIRAIVRPQAVKFEQVGSGGRRLT